MPPPDRETRRPLRVAFAASEVAGFAKTGGLADVAAALPRALARRGHELAIFLPLYRTCRLGRTPVEPTAHSVRVPVGGRPVTGRVWRSTLPDSQVPVYLIDQPDYFDRDDPAAGRGLYQFATPGGHRRDYADNAERFIFFCHAVLAALPVPGLDPDLLHCNDWQTGLIPVYRRGSDPAPACLYTVHNIAYQGRFPPSEYPLTGLDWKLFNYQQLEFYDTLCFLKAGVVFADRTNTVSPSYAREIQTPYFGHGMEGVLSARRDKLSGIVNGADYREWNPATDPHLPVHYDLPNVADGKAACKSALQQQAGLPPRPRTPLIGVVARLVEQKGIDLIIRAGDALLSQDVQLVILGEGDPDYHHRLAALRGRHPEKMALAVGFDEPLAHRVEAGADLFLMPSLFEPAGLNQLYSLRYGTPPVVRATGGLADTIVDTNDATLAAGTATGFRFVAYSSGAMLATLMRACDLYRHRPDLWLWLQRNGMRQDWSWDRSAAAYEDLYRLTIAEAHAR